MSFKINFRVVLGVPQLSISWPIATFHWGYSTCKCLYNVILWCLALGELMLQLPSLYVSLFYPVSYFRETCSNMTALKLLSLSNWAESNQLIQKLLEMHAHAHHDYICIIFEGSQAEKIKSDLISDRCILMFRELEKMTLFYGWSYKYALPQLIARPPMTKMGIRLLFFTQNIDGFCDTEGKLLFQYFNNVSRLGTRAERCVPVADMVSHFYSGVCWRRKPLSSA